MLKRRRRRRLTRRQIFVRLALVIFWTIGVQSLIGPI